MKHIVETSWNEKMQFTSVVDSHKVIVDTTLENGGQNQGPTPKKLLLSALAGCTGMDVVSILNKMKVEYTYFNIIAEANLTEEHPMYYDNIHLIYQFKGNNLDKEKLAKAVKLSQDKYCGVAHMYKQAANITFEVVILA